MPPVNTPHKKEKLDAVIEILKALPGDDIFDPEVLATLQAQTQARYKEIDARHIADQHEADLEAEGFIVEKDEPFSFITFSSNNFGRTNGDTNKEQ